jgi:hypothetical protein
MNPSDSIYQRGGSRGRQWLVGVLRWSKFPVESAVFLALGSELHPSKGLSLTIAPSSNCTIKPKLGGWYPEPAITGPRKSRILAVGKMKGLARKC